MGDLIAKTLPLAVGAAVSPILLITVVLLLSGDRKPKARALAFAIGNVVALALVAVVVLVLLDSVGHTGTGSTKAGSLMDLTIGVLLAVFGVGKLVEYGYRRVTGEGSGASATPETDHGGNTKGRVFGSFALGLGLVATNVTTIALYLSALKNIAEAKVSTGERIVVIAIAIVVIMVPVAVPLLITVAVPGASARMLAALRGFVTRYRDLIMGIFVTLFGIYLVVKGAGGF